MAKLDRFIIDDTTYELVPEIAPLFDPATPYSVGDCVIHDAVLYKFTANHAAGAWTGNDVVAFEVAEYLNDVNEDTNFYPYGIEPFQLSLFKKTENLFSNFCYHITKSYYRERTDASPIGRPRITVTPNWQGWLIRIKPSTMYTLGPLDYKLELLDKEFNSDITITSFSDANPNTITTGNNSYWLCLTQRTGRDMSGWMMVEGDTYPSSYISGAPELVEDFKNSANKYSLVETAWSNNTFATADGMITKSTTRCMSDYLFVSKGSEVIVDPNGQQTITGFLNLDKDAFTSLDSTWTDTKTTFSIAEDGWILVQVRKDSTNQNISSSEVTVNIKMLLNVPNSFSAMKNNIDSEMNFHPYGIELFQLSLFKQTPNLFSNFCYHITRGYYRDRTSSSTKMCPRITATPNWQGWIIRVKPSTTYTLGPLDYKIEFLRKDFTSDITVDNVSSTESNTMTSGPNSYWLCLTQGSSKDMSDWMMVEGDTYPSEYISGAPQWVEEPKSPVINKTIAFFGDSITSGSGVTGQPESQCFHQYIHDLYGYTCLNYGYGGSGYVRSYTGTTGLHGIGEPGRGVSNANGFTPNNVRTRLAEVDSTEVDAVVIFAGTNDWSNAVTLTDFGAELDAVFNYYQNNFGSVPLLVMTPIHRLNDTEPEGRQLIDYVDMIIRKCREHGVPYVDTFTTSGLQPNNEGNRAVFFPRDDSGNDGIHPNHLAHQRLARAIGETLSQLVLWDTNVKK